MNIMTQSLQQHPLLWIITLVVAVTIIGLIAFQSTRKSRIYKRHGVKPKMTPTTVNKRTYSNYHWPSQARREWR